MREFFSAQRAEFESDFNAGRNPFLSWGKWDAILLQMIVPTAQSGADLAKKNVMGFVESKKSARAESNLKQGLIATEKASLINSTTRKKLQAVIDTGAKEIKDFVKVWSSALKSRSTLIGVDVSTTATNTGLIDGMTQTGVGKKQWVSQKDVYTRESHAAAHGQTVSRDDAFVVGGALLRFPGDPLGPDDEVINCRCYITIGG